MAGHAIPAPAGPITLIDGLTLVLLAGLWGASFLFNRVAAPEFGALPCAGVRAAGAALSLLPFALLARRDQGRRVRWSQLVIVGLAGSGLPFLCYSFAATRAPAGVSSIVNAATPLWGAAIGWMWTRDALTRTQVIGLLLGFAGVVGFSMAGSSLAVGQVAALDASVAAALLVATALYGFAANYARHRLSGASALQLAAGSQIASALFLALPALQAWPAVPPSAIAWVSVLVQSVACTGLAYILYFRLIARTGPARAMTVTYLMPVFAMMFGALFLAEAITTAMVAATVVILSGTAMATKASARTP